jgi:hypothetical protein
MESIGETELTRERDYPGLAITGMPPISGSEGEDSRLPETRRNLALDATV